MPKVQGASDSRPFGRTPLTIDSAARRTGFYIPMYPAAINKSADGPEAVHCVLPYTVGITVHGNPIPSLIPSPILPELSLSLSSSLRETSNK
ncbi:hypothetical protein M5D96_000125 [Drosophila gunungcola]|uniref:Uncharacterized protein n=1 Tax=Drosophila gunungcola TaxID=103775 RepID=A0A9P9YVQ6_9MUSC|nr:hypothetical protein M5D96_000125 [Drosophila gunungcola]